MIESLPAYINVIFIITACISLLIFFFASKKSTVVLVVLSGWLLLQAILSLRGFYEVTDTVPPRLAVMIVPPLLAMLVLFTTKRGKQYVDGLDKKLLTYLHVVRVPVEIVLFWLFSNNLVPVLMTFEGRNFDIFSGITAPLVAYFGYQQKKLGKGILLLWNFICLGLVLNVVIHGILSAPSAFQQLAFDQPNTGVLYFPFVWLPAFIVPLVMFSHFACIRELFRKE